MLQGMLEEVVHTEKISPSFICYHSLISQVTFLTNNNIFFPDVKDIGGGGVWTKQ